MLVYCITILMTLPITAPDRIVLADGIILMSKW
jgi:hypothetical protein